MTRDCILSHRIEQNIESTSTYFDVDRGPSDPRYVSLYSPSNPPIEVKVFEVVLQ